MCMNTTAPTGSRWARQAWATLPTSPHQPWLCTAATSSWGRSIRPEAARYTSTPGRAPGRRYPRVGSTARTTPSCFPLPSAAASCTREPTTPTPEPRCGAMTALPSPGPRWATRASTGRETTWVLPRWRRSGAASMPGRRTATPGRRCGAMTAPPSPGPRWATPGWARPPTRTCPPWSPTTTATGTSSTPGLGT